MNRISQAKHLLQAFEKRGQYSGDAAPRQATKMPKWAFDSISSGGQYMTRIMIAVLVIIYGIFTQQSD